MDNPTNAIIIVILAIILILALKGGVKRLKGGCCGGGGGVKKVRPKDSNKKSYPYKYTVKIGGMTCKNCSTRLENSFNSKDGFFARVSLRKGECTVLCKSEQSPDELRAVVERAGYEFGGVERV